MAAIHILDPHTAELIAAGEVVERPASVVKELMENAIDAGAKNITVSIERGGVGMIQIADDGSGVEAEDIPTAFIRHATSKIAKETDLDSIHTLGFRGEALASIASVSHMELLTRTAADEFAYLYRISGGVEQGIEPSARPVGTTVTVRDLFYNTPARMKFLKKDISEGNYVADIVRQLALSHPETAFKFVREGKPQFQTPGDGNLLSAAYAVLSRDFAKATLPVQSAVRQYTVHGIVTLPQESRASRGMQFFYVNRRFVKDRTMMAALEAAYKGVTMQGKYPGCVLFLDMPHALVDVNVHPAKTEIRFAQERDVFDAVYQSVKDAVFTQIQGAPPAAGAKATEEKPVVPAPPVEHPVEPSAAQESEKASLPPEDVGDASETAAPLLRGCITPEIHAKPTDLEMPVYVLKHDDPAPDALESAPLPYRVSRALNIQVEDEAGPPPAPPQEAPAQTYFAPLGGEDRPVLLLVGEVFGTYLIAQYGDDLCFLDKHAAHERILYEALTAVQGKVSSQFLLTPVTVQLAAQEKDALLQSQALLQDNGVEVDDFGDGCVVVRAIPADVAPENVQDLITELAGRLMLDPYAATSEKKEWVLASLCCRAAIKAGDRTHTEEMMRLAENILGGKTPPFCPHGRPIVWKMTRKELEKRFGRLG